MQAEPPLFRSEPRWRVALYWGAVISFFTLPLAILSIHLVAIAYPELLRGHAGGHLGEFKYIFEFHRTLAALVFGLAGLDTGELIVAMVKRASSPEAELPGPKGK